MDLVDEQDAARSEVGEEPREVPGALDHRARGLRDLYAQLVRENRRQGGLAEAGRPVEQDVVQRLAALAGGREEDAELFLEPRLPDELVELGGPEPRLRLSSVRGTPSLRVWFNESP
jgi:hypothetical protein